MPREGFWLAPQDRIKVYVSLAALAGALTVASLFLIAFVAFIWPHGQSATRSLFLAGAVDDFEVGKPVTFPGGKFHLVKQPDGTFLALYWASPHLGCAVPWRENFVFQSGRGWFRDPCYGSTFDVNGVRVFGPSDRNMDRFPVHVADGKVYVDADIDNLIIGERPENSVAPH